MTGRGDVACGDLAWCLVSKITSDGCCGDAECYISLERIGDDERGDLECGDVKWYLRPKEEAMTGELMLSDVHEPKRTDGDECDECSPSPQRRVEVAFRAPPETQTAGPATFSAPGRPKGV